MPRKPSSVARHRHSAKRKQKAQRGTSAGKPGIGRWPPVEGYRGKSPDGRNMPEWKLAKAIRQINKPKDPDDVKHEA
jgi:hypothetical protein